MNQTTAVYRDSLRVAIIKNVITLSVCVSIVYVNGTLVHIFTRHQIFNKNPRYILYIHLVINDIIMVVVYILLQGLSYIMFTINVSLCIVLLMTALLASQNNPLTVVLMSVECYVAICFPLHHSRVCTVRRTYVVIALTWLVNSLSILPDFFITLGTETSEFFHSRSFCLRANVFRGNLENKRRISDIAFFVILWLILLYTYVNIWFAAQTAAANSKKARNTILLHGFQLLLGMLTFLFNEIIQSFGLRFPRSIPNIRFAVAALIQLVPRIINPIIYAIRDKTFKKYLRKYLLFTANDADVHPIKTQKRSL